MRVVVGILLIIGAIVFGLIVGSKLQVWRGRFGGESRTSGRDCEEKLRR
jgi:hypothetical protein